MFTKYNDISLHFTLKGQTLEQIKEKLKNHIDKNPDSPLSDFVKGENWHEKVLHHCFLPDLIIEEKGFSMDISVFIKSLSEDTVCWYGASQTTLDNDRYYMLRNLKRVKGLAVFIGDTNEGVKTELKYAHHLGCDTLIIP